MIISEVKLNFLLIIIGIRFHDDYWLWLALYAEFHKFFFFFNTKTFFSICFTATLIWCKQWNENGNFTNYMNPIEIFLIREENNRKTNEMNWIITLILVLKKMCRIIPFENNIKFINNSMWPNQFVLCIFNNEMNQMKDYLKI